VASESGLSVKEVQRFSVADIPVQTERSTVLAIATTAQQDSPWGMKGAAKIPARSG
jgi:hypothetical protein